MEWSQCFCMSQVCGVNVWLVARSPESSVLWWVKDHTGEYPHTIAAVKPICPGCGNDLLSELEIEGGFGGISAPEEGPVFDFLRSLR